jgi:hypothetical protein
MQEEIKEESQNYLNNKLLDNEWIEFLRQMHVEDLFSYNFQPSSECVSSHLFRSSLEHQFAVACDGKMQSPESKKDDSTNESKKSNGVHETNEMEETKETGEMKETKEKHHEIKRKKQPKPPPKKLQTYIPTPYELIISTKTKVLFLNCKNIDIHHIFWYIPIMDYWHPGIGIIKKQIKVVFKAKEDIQEYERKLQTIEYYQEHILKQIDNPDAISIQFKDERKITIGVSKKDLIVQKTKIKNAFYNCMALVIRFPFENIHREVHVKIFNTGKMEIPGVVNYQILEYVKTLILQFLQPFIEESLQFEENYLEEHVLINSNFSCGYFVARERLYELLSGDKYRLETTYDPCNYPGVKSKFYFYNEYGFDRNLQKGFILDEDRNLKLFELLKAKKYTEISFMVFRTGSCIIVGNCSEPVLRFVYEFIKELLQQHCEYIRTNYEIPQTKIKNAKTQKKTVYFDETEEEGGEEEEDTHPSF